MPRYFSVDEAANILGTTDRTVRRMLATGRLNGSQHMDKGKQVWRVHASKEILERLQEPEEAIVDIAEVGPQTNFSPESASAESVPKVEPGAWQEEAQAKTASFAELFWNEVAGKFMERLEAKDQHIGMLEAELAEKDRQLKLLPDLQKRAEEERLAIEIKELESKALRKQIEALEEAKAAELAEVQKRAEELERDLKLALDEKSSADAAAALKLAELNGRVEELQKPWWKKVWG